MVGGYNGFEPLSLKSALTGEEPQDKDTFLKSLRSPFLCSPFFVCFSTVKLLTLLTRETGFCYRRGIEPKLTLDWITNEAAV